MAEYLVVCGLFCWILWRCKVVWLLAVGSKKERLINSFAQHCIAFSITLSLIAIGLSICMFARGGKLDLVAHYWAMFDVVVGVWMLATLNYLEKSLKAGRQG